MHGHVKVPRRFVVPEDPSYPVKARGVSLGRVLREVRFAGTHDAHREQLCALGLDMQTERNVSFSKIVTALEAFKAAHGHVDVPLDYVLSVGEEGDKKEMSGSNGLRSAGLGKLLQDKLRGKLSKRRTKQLKKLGVVLDQTESSKIVQPV